MASRDQCKRAIDRHQEELKKLKHFNGLGIRPVEDGQKQAGKTQYAVAVYVTRKVSEDELDHDDIVPESLEVPGRGKVIQVPTRVIDLGGEIQLERGAPKT